MGNGGLDSHNRKWKAANKQDILTIFGIMTLLVGFGISVFIYLTADNYENNFLGYEVIGGSAYPIKPEDSKVYQRDLQWSAEKRLCLSISSRVGSQDFGMGNLWHLW